MPFSARLYRSLITGLLRLRPDSISIQHIPEERQLFLPDLQMAVVPHHVLSISKSSHGSPGNCQYDEELHIHDIVHYTCTMSCMLQVSQQVCGVNKDVNPLFHPEMFARLTWYQISNEPIRGCSKSWPQLSRSLLYARTCSRTKYSCEWAWRDYFITHLMIDSSHCCGSNVLRLYIPVWPSLKKDHRTNSRLYFALTWTITYMMYMYRDIGTILRQAIRKQNHISCATRSLCQIFVGPRLHVFSLLLARLAILNTGQECSTRLFLERRTFPGCLSRDLHFSLSQQYPYVRYCPLHVNFFFHFSFSFNTWEHILKSYCTKEETDMTDYS